ncbi:MAG: hypothetical protein HC800_02695 [Phormidesmis sp. RL_2_1]|nr:hypothetical protein [Phormidesmis sp. RL_2_1]
MVDNSNGNPEQITLSLTPGSDFVFNFRRDQNVWGRHGNDTLLGFDPLAPTPPPPPLTQLEGSASQFRYNVLLGDFIEEKLAPELFARPDQVPPGRDTFILGDWRKPYYLDDFALGLQQIAIIADFEPEFDTITLHGSKSEYLLIPFALAGPDPDGEFTTVNGKALVWIGSGLTRKTAFDVNQVLDALQESGLVENYDGFDKTVKELFNIEEFEENIPETVRVNVDLGGTDVGEAPEFRASKADNSFILDFDPGDRTLKLNGKAFEVTDSNLAIDASDNDATKVAKNSLKAAQQAAEKAAKEAEKAAKANTKAAQDAAKEAEKAAQKAAKEAEKALKKNKDFNVDIDDILASTPDFDIIGFFPDVPPGGAGLPPEGLPLPDISLDGSYFNFVGKAPPTGPAYQAIKQLGTAGVDLAINVTTDQKGNFYILGNTTGSLGDLNQGGYDVWIAKYDKKGKQKWIRQYGTAAGDVGWEIEAFTDSKGKTNLYITGATTGNFAQKYGGTSLNEGYQDIWIARLDHQGKFQWVKQNPQPIVGPEIDNSLNIDVDTAGNLYQSGITIEKVDSPLVTVQDFAWVAKYNPNGDLQWFNGDSLESTDQFGFDETYGVAVDNDGATVAIGFAQNNLGGPRIGVYDIWISKFDQQGNQAWIEKFGSVNYEFGWGVDTDSQNNAYVAGLTRGDLGGANQGENDVFIAKYDGNGEQQWVQQFGTAGDDGLYLGDIAVDAFDNIYVTGFTDSILGDGSNRGSYDAWVAKYNAEGQQLWLSQFGSSELDFASGLTTDEQGQVYVTGYTQGSLGSLNQGSVDAWITKVNPLTGAVTSFSVDVGIKG